MIVQIYTQYLKKTNNLPLILKKHHKTTEDGILILCFFHLLQIIKGCAIDL